MYILSILEFLDLTTATEKIQYLDDEDYIDRFVDQHIEPEGYLTDDDKSEIIEYLNNIGCEYHVK